MERLKLELEELVQDLNISESIAALNKRFNGRLALSTAFGQEGQVLTDIIFKNDHPVKVFTIDTGRMFQETYEVYSRTTARYNKPIKVYFPDRDDVENLIQEKGPNSFYESIENRKECCFIRKLKPLRRALFGVDVWISGLRNGQSDFRKSLSRFEWDDRFKVIKYHPMINWTDQDVKDYLDDHNVPYNRLHDQGYPSIGCAPCTRPVAPGESARAGRWWWETSKKECGLHSA